MKSLVVSKRQKNEKDATREVTQTLKYFIKLATVYSVPTARTHEHAYAYPRSKLAISLLHGIRPHAIIYRTDTCVICSRMCKSHLTIRYFEWLGRTHQTHTLTISANSEMRKAIDLVNNVSLAKVRCRRCHTKFN